MGKKIRVLVLSGNLAYDLERLDDTEIIVENTITGVSTFRCVSCGSKNRIEGTVEKGNFDYIVIRSFIVPERRDVGITKLELLKKDNAAVVVIVSNFILEDREKEPYRKLGVKNFTNARDIFGYFEALIALKRAV